MAVVDTNPDPKRPYSTDPTGKTDNEDIVVGRSRGEQSADGSYHGHVTVVGVFGNEIVGVDSKPGEKGSPPAPPAPLDALQTSLLDALCGGSGNQLCISVLPVNSTRSSNGSSNHFGVAHATVGGASGIDLGVAESNGNISSDGTCQTSHGDSSAADVKAGGQAVASAAQSSTDSSACSGQAATQKDSSSVLTLGGTGVPIPAPGCDNGTPDTVTGIPTLLPLVCNGDDSDAGQASDPYGVRDALDAFVLATGTTAAAKLTTSGSESHAMAPAGGTETQPSNGVSGSAVTPTSSPNAFKNTNASGVKGVGANGKPECSDGVDNDGDDLVDAGDPGCHTDGNADNPSSYNPNDDSEVNGAVPASSAGLPFTGTDVVGLALIGALLLAAGLALRAHLPQRRLQA